MKVKALGTVGVVVGQGDDAGLTMEMRQGSLVPFPLKMCLVFGHLGNNTDN